jgi:Transposase IS66 family
VAEILRARVLADPIVRVDDTALPVLDKRHKSGIYKGHLWVFAGVGPLVAYTFTKGWTADEISPYLSVIDGFIQCDDYKGYSTRLTLPDGTKRMLVDPARRLGRMMHVRRRFHEALKLGDKRAARGIELIGSLYEIERIAKDGRPARSSGSSCARAHWRMCRAICRPEGEGRQRPQSARRARIGCARIRWSASRRAFSWVWAAASPRWRSRGRAYSTKRGAKMGTPPLRPITTVFMQSNASTAVRPPKKEKARSTQRRNESIARDSTNSRYISTGTSS